MSDCFAVSTDVVKELPLAAMVLALLVSAFFVGTIVGAEAIAAGEPTFPPTLLPGLVWGGRATDTYLALYQTTTNVLWVCAVAVLATTAATALRGR